MACGVLLRRISSQPVAKVTWKPWEIVCSLRAEQCRSDPNPDSPHAILILSDGNKDEVDKILGTLDAADGRTIGLARFAIEPNLLPPDVLVTLSKSGRATCARADFMEAARHQDPLSPLKLSELGFQEKAPIKIDRSKDPAEAVNIG